MDSLEERSRLSSASSDIDIQIHSNREFGEIMQSALEGFVRALGADVGDIKLLEGDRWVVRYQTGFGSDALGMHLSAAEAPVAEEVARLRQPVIVADYLAQDRISYVGFPLRFGLRSTIALPLFVRDEVIGCLFAWMRTRPREYTPSELEFARRMAASVALALENARLFEAEQLARQRAEQTEARLEQELGVTRILLKASDEFSSTTEPEELLERLARVAIEATGISRAFVNLIDVTGRVLIPKVATGGLSAPWGDRIPLSELSETSQRAIAAMRTAVLDYEGPDVPEHDRNIALANRSKVVLFVPLMHRSQIIGHITLDEPGQRSDFSANQIRVVESIAAQAAVAIQNALQFEREHRIAETLQQALLAPLEQIDTIDIAFRYRAASVATRVGGDFYDAFNLDGDRVAVVVGDVSGKGIGAAPLTALLRDGVRAYLLENDDPGGCFGRLNSLIYRFTPVEKFATAFVGIIDHSKNEFTYCCAAHPAPVVRSTNGVRSLDCQPSTLLGAFPDARFHSQTIALEPGDVLVMVTDGMTEARRDGALFGEAGLLSAVDRLRGLSVQEMPDALLSEVVEFADEGLRDDVVVLCVATRA